ncbi:hypothetical protein J6590_070938 [Homalodisca vitripennis]|nr:hypothetical protein J6590_070938 [Homalodisca vitripennis]
MSSLVKGKYQKYGALVTTPYRKWKDVIGKFNSHSNSSTTKFDSGRIEGTKVMLDSLDKKEKEQNRASLKRIIDTTIFCGENEIPLRGHWATDGRKPFRKGGQFSSVARTKVMTTLLFFSCSMLYFLISLKIWGGPDPLDPPFGTPLRQASCADEQEMISLCTSRFVVVSQSGPRLPHTYLQPQSGLSNRSVGSAEAWRGYPDWRARISYLLHQAEPHAPSDKLRSTFQVLPERVAQQQGQLLALQEAEAVGRLLLQEAEAVGRLLLQEAEAVGRLLLQEAEEVGPLLLQEGKAVGPLLLQEEGVVGPLLLLEAEAVGPLLLQEVEAVGRLLLQEAEAVGPLLLQEAVGPLLQQEGEAVGPLLLQEEGAVGPLLLLEAEAVGPLLLLEEEAVGRLLLQEAEAVGPLLLQEEEAVGPLLLQEAEAVGPLLLQEEEGGTTTAAGGGSSLSPAGRSARGCICNIQWNEYE